MSTMIQIRNVPPEFHNKLKVRAAAAGMSLSDYLLRELRRAEELPTWDEFFSGLRTRKPVRLPRPAVEYIREVREQR